MDAQAQRRSLGSQPGNLRSDVEPTTVVMGSNVPAPVTAPVESDSVQGSFFADDPYSTYRDTAPTPVVPVPQQPGYERNARKPTKPHKPRGSLGLRIAVTVTALAVLAGGAALGLVRSGVIHTDANSGQSGQGAAPPAVTHHPGSATKSSSTLVTETYMGTVNANYTVAAGTFALNIETSRDTWVSVGPVGQSPTFAGIMSGSSVKHMVFSGPTQLDIGAGGSTVVVSANHHTQTLTPPSAPFTYQFTPQ